jgi:hypothetical protein
MVQVWLDLCFAHWPVEPSSLRRAGPAAVPAGLELDTFDGAAWISVVPFRMRGVRPRGFPAMPWLSAFPELNVRTYVVRDERPGVFFYSLDAANPVAVRLARAWFHLPYFDAQMRCRRDDGVDGAVEYASTRTHRGAPPADFAAGYRPVGPVELARSETLEHWLTERYCLYAARRDGVLLRAEIHHRPWPLRPVRLELRENSMAAAVGLELGGPPASVQFADRLDVRCWSPRVVG